MMHRFLIVFFFSFQSLLYAAEISTRPAVAPQSLEPIRYSVNLSFSPPNPKPGDVITYKADIKNLTRTRSMSGYSYLFRAPDRVSDQLSRHPGSDRCGGGPGSGGQISNILPGQTITVTDQRDSPTVACQGNIMFSIWGPSNQTGGTYELPIKFAQHMPDLTITALTVDPPNPREDQPFVLKVTIRNIGTDFATFDNIHAMVCVSEPASTAGLLPFPCAKGPDRLAPGESRILTLNPTQVARTAGVHVWEATVNPEHSAHNPSGKIAENVMNNNTQRITVTVMPANR